MRKTKLKIRTVSRLLIGMYLLITFGLVYGSSSVEASGETGSSGEDEATLVAPEYTIPEVSAFCGDKLADAKIVQPDNGEFVWNNEDTIVKEGAKTHEAKFVPKDTKKYKTVENIPIEVTILHNDITKLTPVGRVDATDEEEGMYEHFECPVCKGLVGSDGLLHDNAYFIKPYVEEEISVTLGKKLEIEEYVMLGDDGVESVEIKDSEKYNQLIYVDENTKALVSPANAKYYKKKKIGTPTLVVTDYMGTTHKAKLRLSIAKPYKFVISKEPIVKSGIKIYKYTLKCEAKYADGIIIEATGGTADKATKDKLNNIIKQRIEKNLKKSNKKASVTVVFTAKERSIKGKITFKARAKYGKNTSLAFTKKK